MTCPASPTNVGQAGRGARLSSLPALHLANALQGNQTLHVLNLNMNSMTDLAAEMLAKCFRHNRTLTTLSLQNNDGIPDKWLEQIDGLLASAAPPFDKRKRRQKREADKQAEQLRVGEQAWDGGRKRDGVLAGRRQRARAFRMSILRARRGDPTGISRARRREEEEEQERIEREEVERKHAEMEEKKRRLRAAEREQAREERRKAAFCRRKSGGGGSLFAQKEEYVNTIVSN
eukprot:gene11332-6464_t